MNIKNTRSVSASIPTLEEDRKLSAPVSTASDVARAGLRLLEEHQSKLSGLQAAPLNGERSGVSGGDVLDI